MQSEEKLSVLIVDDEPSLNELFVLGLNKSGFYAEGVLGGIECLEKLQTGYRPDVILLDLIMDQMDGWETLRHIKTNEETADILVLMQTGKNLTYHEAKIFSPWIMDYIMKPVTPKSTIERIHKAVQLHKNLLEIRNTGITSGLADAEVNECLETYRNLIVAKELAHLLESKRGSNDGHSLSGVEEYEKFVSSLEMKYEALDVKNHLNIAVCESITRSWSVDQNEML